MTFCIITHVPHKEKDGNYFAYSPYVNEMNLWIKNVEKVIVVAPKDDFELNPIHDYYKHSNIDFLELKKFNLLSFKSSIQSLFSVIANLVIIYKAMKRSDHIHLRCPGNIGLLGCFVQILFPKKPKTTKYAGNWDPNAKQPLSYKLQKWILSNTFLTKNMTVLVYGEWENQSNNIKPFFTATYYNSEIISVQKQNFDDQINFIFVGTLSVGKQPIYAIKIVENLKNLGYNVLLSIFGDGNEKENLHNYILNNKLDKFISLEGNKNKEDLKLIYQKCHFLILPSKSEGWPKVVAEAMFWGCFPIATNVSCVANMLDNGKRGILLSENLDNDCSEIIKTINNESVYDQKINNAINWSRNFTIDKFENEIKLLLQK